MTAPKKRDTFCVQLLLSMKNICLVSHFFERNGHQEVSENIRMQFLHCEWNSFEVMVVWSALHISFKLMVYCSLRIFVSVSGTLQAQ